MAQLPCHCRHHCNGNPGIRTRLLKSLRITVLPRWPICSSLVLTVKICQLSVRVLRRWRTRSSSQFREARVLFFWLIPLKNCGLLEFCCLFVVVIRHFCCFMKVNLQFPSRRNEGKNPHHWGHLVESCHDKNGFPAFPGNNLSLTHSVLLSMAI